jgi:hypothetical protein
MQTPHKRTYYVRFRFVKLYATPAPVMPVCDGGAGASLADADGGGDKLGCKLLLASGVLLLWAVMRAEPAVEVDPLVPEEVAELVAFVTLALTLTLTLALALLLAIPAINDDTATVGAEASVSSVSCDAETCCAAADPRTNAARVMYAPPFIAGVVL